MINEVKMKKLTPYLLIFLTLFWFGFGSDKPQLTPEELLSARVDSVLSLMSLDEKIGQLNQLSYGIGWGPTVKVSVPNEYKELIKEGKIGSFLNAIGAEFTYELQKIAVNESRLKIPLIFGLDVIHGFKTIFPVPLGEAATWQPEIIEMSAHYQALEAASAGIHWTFSPMVDIARDPRWGRIMEGSGEDPYLGSLMAAARVRGYQENLSNLNIIACAKHYAGYGGAEGGRDYNTVDFSERTFRDVYLPPFKAAVDAGAHTIMASFNEIGGIPSSGSKRLLTDILRDEWGFKGFVVSDWNSIGELINHGFASDLKHAGQISLNAGLDMDMESRSYITHLKELEDEGKVDEDLIDESVKRILRVKFMLGLFDDPYRYCQKEREQKNIMTDEVRIAALEVAKRSMVLLKNEKNILPLKKTYKRIGVIGPLANSKTHPLGGWSAMGDSVDVTTVLEGLKNYVDKKIDIAYAEGCKIDDNSTAGFKNAVNIAKKSDVVVLCLGESRDMSGEACSRSSLDLPGVQEALAKELKKTGKPIVVVLMNGRPLSIPWLNDNANAILEAWFSGVTAGEAIAKVLFGDYNPGGKLPVTFPRTVGQVPIYYNHKNTGRSGDLKNHYTSKYLDLPLTPLYPFGYGLSYTTFSLNDFNLSSGNLTEEDSIIVSVKVKNTGNYDGEEVVQLYIQDLVGSVTRPVKELKGFKKVMLKRGEEKSVQFTIHEKDLRFTTADMKFKSEPGKFKAFVGANSADALEKEFELVE
ncbi:MAG: glycosyl hydrolase [Ignavibacteria bacterium RIFOXYB2_FULL_35_12]|nr:MAG: glycosyl hydrolase [Ignavibacteria bacterium GWA2_36_19]OGU53993.1 MAG: glycosyl hydrolase [Ignavibacteria bacterium GWC2_35_8]OGU57749.1 MAG: glycosyl hydrolase [Ignavibacteria bacterium GWF2_35_20]OGU81608.1 MAG: glycosyl hydrolase [Ignavibacteria bacterium RIFOXYA2_FULL_35_9]OGU89187.1 MAG: glycosyl hydrolase [Ignavibacteria bacterium RIFOXYA12_FULL_35_25]OGU89731.1 MAG: glycosyl hydrolase [Ignavibacteria bacterium RIFOXYC12_FULL_35_11]OGU96783.1 MAG: glycosyl hydrolase [Ignavibact